MIEQGRNQQLGVITSLPAGLLQAPPRFRLLRDREPSFLSRLLRRIGGSIAYHFYW